MIESEQKGDDQSQTNRLQTLTPGLIAQINAAINEVARYPYAEIVLVVKRGAVRYIRSSKNEPVKGE